MNDYPVVVVLGNREITSFFQQKGVSQEDAVEKAIDSTIETHPSFKRSALKAYSLDEYLRVFD